MKVKWEKKRAKARRRGKRRCEKRRQRSEHEGKNFGRGEDGEGGGEALHRKIRSRTTGTRQIRISGNWASTSFSTYAVSFKFKLISSRLVFAPVGFSGPLNEYKDIKRCPVLYPSAG